MLARKAAVWPTHFLSSIRTSQMVLVRCQRLKMASLPGLTW